MQEQQGNTNHKKNGYMNRAFDGVVSKLEGHHGKFDVAINHQESSTEPAVSVRNAFKSYTTRGQKRPILYNLNMTVKKGTMYAYLKSFNLLSN